MERLIPIGIILSLSGIGFILKIIQIRNYIIRIESCTDYQDKFIDLVNKYTSTYQLDNALYSELTRKSIPMQRELGLDGEIDMVDNLRGLKFNGYQVLLNFLPEIREMDDWHNNSIMRQRFMTLAHTCDDMFTRHIGHLDDLLEYEKKYLYNPFSCFSSGIRWILWLPSNILLWCGFISENTGNKLRYNWFIKTLTFIVTIIGLISSAVTIVIGWEQFNEMILRWINK